MIPRGYQNEFYFVMEFNNKKIKNLNPLLREVIDYIFPDENKESIIKSWRNHNNFQKGDILVKVNNKVRSISIKMGSRNSVHVEHLDSFIDFLLDNKVNVKAIKYYQEYHYNKEKNRHNEYINKKLAKVNTDIYVDRFILKGRFQKQPVEGIIYGTPADFLWINKEDIKKIIKNNINKQSSGTHISSLFIQPMNRNYTNNPKYNKLKDYIQIKWYSLFDDIIDNNNNKVINSKTHK